MNIFAIFFLSSLVISNIFLIAALIIENNFSEDHPVMKWWINHIVGKFPDDDPNF